LSKLKKYGPLLEEFFNEFMVYSNSYYSHNGFLSIKITLKAFLLFCGNIRIEEISKKTVIKFIEERMQHLSPPTIRRDICNLSSAFKWGILNEYLKENYATGIPKPKIVQKLPIYFSDSEIKLLLDNTSSNDLKELFLFAINSGLRESELITLTWRQIDFRNKILVLDNSEHLTKNKKIWSIPLNITCMQILFERERKKMSKKYVFSYNNEKIKQQFISHKIKKIIKKAGLRDELNFHCLRKTFATRLVQKGVPIYNVSKLLSHSDTRVTQIYAALDVENLRDSVELLDNQNLHLVKNSDGIVKEVNKILGY